MLSSLDPPPTDPSGRAAGRKEVVDHKELWIALHKHITPETVYKRELLIAEGNWQATNQSSTR
jgi:hypothetical protein